MWCYISRNAQYSGLTSYYRQTVLISDKYSITQPKIIDTVCSKVSNEDEEELKLSM